MTSAQDNVLVTTKHPLEAEASFRNFLEQAQDGSGDQMFINNEDEDQDFNPIDDISVNDGVSIAHYLNELEISDYCSPGFRDDNEYTRTVSASFFITGFSLEILSATELDFGTLEYSFTLPEDD